MHDPLSASPLPSALPPTGGLPPIAAQRAHGDSRAVAAGLLLLGAAALLASLAGVATLPLDARLQVLGGLAVAAVAVLFPVRIPGARHAYTASEIVVCLLLLMHGVAAATLTAALAAALASVRQPGKPLRRVVRPASAAFITFVIGSALQATLLGLQSRGAASDALVVLATVFFAIGGFALRTLMAVLLARPQGGPPLHAPGLLAQTGWAGILHAVAAMSAALLHVSAQKVGVGLVLTAAVPVIAMLLTMLHYHVRQRESEDQAQRERVESAEREAAQAARHLRELQVSERRFHSAFSHAAIGMALVSTEGRVLQANPALCRLLGRDEPDVLGQPFAAFVHAEDVAVLAQLLDGADHEREPGRGVELRCSAPDGPDVWVAMHGARFAERESDRPCLILQAQDITARRDAEARLQRIAYNDGLTSLANRIRFGQSLAQAVERCRSDRRRNFALMYLDFDRFKLINDTLGHAVGDEFLVTVAQRIQSQVRPEDTVGRLGGDEFGILIEDLDGEHLAVTMAERLQEVLSRPYAIGGTEVNSSASIGITFSSVGYDTPGDVLRDADIAMYRAKAGGRARYALFDASLRAQIADQLHLEGDLRRSIDGDQLFLAFQPIYDLRSGRIGSFEALLRWNHPERGLIGPEVFLPIAEEAGLIASLTERVLMRACAQLAAWQRAEGGRPRLRMQVNVSGSDLCRLSLVAHVTRALTTHALEPWQLTLEITESMLMQRLDAALATMMQLRELGVGLSVDDFGTGYSSLSYLSTLPITSLKIDRSFVQRLQDGHRNSEIVKAIVTLGHSLGRAVIAEGIESPAQLAMLREFECGYGQGYLLARPLSAEMAAAWLKSESQTMPAGAYDSRWHFDSTGFGHLTMH